MTGQYEFKLSARQSGKKNKYTAYKIDGTANDKLQNSHPVKKNVHHQPAQRKLRAKCKFFARRHNMEGTLYNAVQVGRRICWWAEDLWTDSRAHVIVRCEDRLPRVTAPAAVTAGTSPARKNTTRMMGMGTQTEREGENWAVYSLTRGSRWPRPGEGMISMRMIASTR